MVIYLSIPLLCSGKGKLNYCTDGFLQLHFTNLLLLNEFRIGEHFLGKMDKKKLLTKLISAIILKYVSYYLLDFRRQTVVRSF